METMQLETQKLFEDSSDDCVYIDPKNLGLGKIGNP